MMLIKNGIIVDENGAESAQDVLVGKTILEIGNNIEPPSDLDSYHVIIDAAGAYIMPGFIDMNCEICDPGYENIEDLSTVTRSAAKGGFTSITSQPNTKPIVDNKTVVNYIISRAAQLSMVNVHVYGSMTVGGEGEKIAEIGEMVNAGIVALSDGGKCLSDAALLRNIMRYSSMFNIPLITTCEDAALSEGGVVNAGKVASAFGLKGIPRESEEIMVARNIILSRNTGRGIHISKVSTRGSVELIREAKAKGVKITCDTQPHYFTLTEDNVDGYNTMVKLKPPLRTWEDVEAVVEGLIDGTIDVISSGHTPATIESKHKEFDMASFGISALETAFAISYVALVSSGKMKLGQLLDKFHKHPADILLLKGKQGVKVGADGDLVIFAPKEENFISPVSFASKAKFSPFAGMMVMGKVKYTVVGGEVVFIADGSGVEGIRTI